MRIVLERVKHNLRCGAKSNLFIDNLLVMDPDQQIEIMISIVLGGHETSGRLILGALFEMMRNPIHIELVRAEIDTYNTFKYNTFDNNTFELESKIDHGAIFNSGHFKYCHLLIKESLRLYPPVWLLSRTCDDDLVIDDLTIKANTMILLSPLIIQRLEKYWGSNAEVFDPLRFETDNNNNDLSKIFFPFVVGREMCPEDKFAVMEPHCKNICVCMQTHIFFVRFASQNSIAKQWKPTLKHM